MTVNLEKNNESMINAWKDVLDDKTSTDWALFSYEGNTNDLKFISKGDGGLEELKDELNSGKIMYAFARVKDPKTSLPKCILINWQGEGAPMVRKGTCANHIRDVSNLLKGAHVTINARNEEEVDPDIIIEKVVKSTGSVYKFGERSDIDIQTTPVGTTYKRTIPKNEINIAERDKFWQKEEEEEKKRIAEERRLKEERRVQEERERQMKEAEHMLNERDSPERVVKKNDSIRQEAEQLIKMRNFDPRAVFEKNTCIGQMTTSSLRRTSNGAAQINSGENNGKVSTWPPEQQQTLANAEYVEQAPCETSAQNANGDQIVTAEPYTQEFMDREALRQELLTNDAYGLKAEALYEYEAADDTEISFEPGDIITNITQLDCGWWQGVALNGTIGLFPACYVELLN